MYGSPIYSNITSGPVSFRLQFFLCMKPMKRWFEFHIWSVSSPLVGHGTLYRGVDWFGLSWLRYEGDPSHPPHVKHRYPCNGPPHDKTDPRCYLQIGKHNSKITLKIFSIQFMKIVNLPDLFFLNIKLGHCYQNTCVCCPIIFKLKSRELWPKWSKFLTHFHFRKLDIW